jgi:hypothetical protein
MTEKNKSIKLVSPKGLAQFPWIQKADTKFDADGVYSVTIKCEDSEQVQKFIAKLEDIRDSFYDQDEGVQKALKTRKAVNKADVCEYDEEGNVYFKFKQKAKLKSKTGDIIDVTVPVFDAKAKPMDELIGRDSLIKVATTIFPYFMQTTKTVGLSLKLTAVQVIELKAPSSGGSGSGFGFEEEEGFTHEEGTKASTPFDTEDETEDNEEEITDF